MTVFVVRRLLLLIPVLLGVVTVTFLLSYTVPGDPARLMLGPRADGDTVESLRLELGLESFELHVHRSSTFQGNLATSLLVSTKSQPFWGSKFWIVHPLCYARRPPLMLSVAVGELIEYLQFLDGFSRFGAFRVALALPE